ncbi:MAG: c-type cytochrome [Deltaproteobacteria bacterium]|nr:c-type cytochrome [Deltaproteobacteria bacterium]
MTVVSSCGQDGAAASAYGADESGLTSGLGFDGRILKTDCNAMSSWYECRDIRTAPAAVQRGYEYIHHTSSTLGPDGTRKFADGTPYARSSNACSSCHFSGGQVPFGLPLMQVNDKYAAKPLFRAFNYKRDARDATLDCFRNCMGNVEVPDKYGDVIDDIMAYVGWTAAGVTDPSMTGAGWESLPGHSWPYFSGDWQSMKADVTNGGAIYEAECHACHGRDGAGQGEYRPGEPRPRYPALWGDRSFTRGAAMYSVPQLAFFTRKHMPFGDPETLSEQEALDVAGFINSQPRAVAHSARMFCDADTATGLPNSLLKPAHWNVGCVDAAEPFSFEQRLLGPWRPIALWRAAEVARRGTTAR